MKGKLAFCFAIAALAVASAKSYTIHLYQPASTGATELKAGDYQVEVVDQKAVISKGSVRVESAVQVQSAAKKYDDTTVLLTAGTGTAKIKEIRLGGTSTKLVFNAPAQP